MAGPPLRCRSYQSETRSYEFPGKSFRNLPMVIRPNSLGLSLFNLINILNFEIILDYKKVANIVQNFCACLISFSIMLASYIATVNLSK
jgi:hypothetical protein